jgi:hypothetical protein
MSSVPDPSSPTHSPADHGPSSSSPTHPSRDDPQPCGSNSSTLLDLPNQPSASDETPHPNPLFNTPPVVGEPSSRSLLPTPMPRSILPLLLCLVCSKTLRHPTTLHCGHTVCSEHVQSSPDDSSDPPPPGGPMLLICPLTSCVSLMNPSSAAAPNIPSTSRVVYVPAPPAHRNVRQHPSRQVTHVPDPKTDVTIGKVMNLISRAQEWIESEDRGLPPDPDRFVPLPPDANDDDDDSDHESDHAVFIEDEHEHEPEPEPEPEPDSSQTPTRSSLGSLHRRPSPRQRGSSASGTISLRPKKRRRCHVSQSSGPTLHPPPSLDPGMDNARARFEKELQSELTCEICFAMMYQPMTTPCQHVSMCHGLFNLIPL